MAGNFPADARLYHEIGQAWHSLYSYEKAKGAYKRAIDINPRFAEAYYYLACTDLGSEEFVDAIDGFNKFLEFDVTVPVGQFKTRVEAFLEMLREEDLY